MHVDSHATDGRLAGDAAASTPSTPHWTFFDASSQGCRGPVARLSRAWMVQRIHALTHADLDGRLPHSPFSSIPAPVRGCAPRPADIKIECRTASANFIKGTTRLTTSTIRPRGVLL